ncbi:MAG: phenylalanine--tRNA ligase subunit alpha [Tenuifilaceae bacterium]|jgi:phenylalanyl-tRNA synthetase alpha chain|nr:phenylalanine--tRNA ligase subunit alpha [Tenuifilaceae bacterium]
MNRKIEEIKREVQELSIKTLKELEDFRVLMLGKKGKITELFSEFKTIPNDQKKEIGKVINDLKNLAVTRIADLKDTLESSSSSSYSYDLSLPGYPSKIGSRHPISLVKEELFDIFKTLGFSVAEGPEIEDDWHVFSSLNFPEEHPARDMQDTFFIKSKPEILLRTHTSSVQIRVMENEKPPIRVICPGRVFRNEAISARAHCIFHQVEGLYVDENVSFADLKQTLLFFAQELFGKDVKIRLRPSYFPFTEPSAEMDVSCNLCGGKGCGVCKYTGWLEILGCGMVDPNVLENCNIDSKKYTGYAFGMGIERIAMLKYQVKDLRMYFENDLRFLNQFRCVL